MAGALVLAVPGLEVAAMIGREEHDRVVQEIEAFQCVEQTPVGLIQAFDHPPVSGKMLMRRAAESEQVGRNPAAFVARPVAIGRRVIVEPILVVRLEV